MNRILDYLRRAMANEDSNTIAALVRELRLRSNKSAREFSQELGLSHDTIGRWERGGTVSKRNMLIVADAAGVTIEQLNDYLERRITLRQLLPDGKLPSHKGLERLKNQAARLPRAAIKDLILYLVELLFSSGERNYSPPTIRSLIEEFLDEDEDNIEQIEISLDRLEALRGGKCPTDEEIEYLAPLFRVSAGRLREIRDREFT